MNFKSPTLKVVNKAFDLLGPAKKKKVILVQCLQILFGLLDLLAVSLIGILGALAISGVKSAVPGNRVSAALRFLHLNHESFHAQIALLGVYAVIIFILRTVLSVIFSRRIIKFLSKNSAILSTELISRLLSSSLMSIQSRSNMQNLYSLTEGVNSLMIGVVGNFLNILTDTSLLLIIGIGLFVIDPLIAVSTFVLFGIIALVLYFALQKRVHRLGNLNAKYSVQSNEMLLEVLDSYREAFVRNRLGFYVNEIGMLRHSTAETSGELTFMPNISKYVIETSVIIGALLISAGQFLLQDAVHAVATLAIFMAGGSRIAPALLRVQQGALNLQSNLGMAKSTLVLMDSLPSGARERILISKLDLIHEDFIPEISVKDLGYNYSESELFTINGLEIEIQAGAVIALVGPSGSGKTTIVDLILGIIKPLKGHILISGLSPDNAISKWPGAISYVPQEITIKNGTIRENVALGYSRDEYSDEQVLEALRMASLGDFTSDLNLGLDTHVGDRGASLSGGQRQRLGIARAFFTKPKLLVFDEATSSLDGETEEQITATLEKIKGKTTLILIAHRLSTVRSADLVIYINNGTIQCQGSFEYVRSQVKDFDKQSKLLGL
jgi:ABC-type multidrug transport system fused ATPase/permease subunit